MTIRSAYNRDGGMTCRSVDNREDGMTGRSVDNRGEVDQLIIEKWDGR